MIMAVTEGHRNHGSKSEDLFEDEIATADGLHFYLLLCILPFFIL